MAVTLENSGTQTATINTEHTLDSINTAGVYTFEVDTNAMADGDIVELRLYKIILTSGVSRVIACQQYFGGQPADDKIKVSIPLGNNLTDTDALKFTLKQITGTGRAYPWKVLKYA